MTAEHAIDALIDGETVDAGALDAALASVEGRSYLIDALALRRLMNDAPDETAILAPRRSRTLHSYARAAIVVVGLVGLGYAAGARDTAVGGDMPLAATPAQATNTPPEPTRIIELKPGVDWHESKGGD